MHISKNYIVLLALLIGTHLFAQPRLRQPEIYFGIHGGVIASTVDFSPKIPNMTPMTNACILGGNGGLVFRYSEQKYCAIQIELNYMQHGWREHTTNTIGTNYSRQLHYLSLPLLMHIYFGSPTWRGFINIGPQIAYCLYDNKGKGKHQESEVHQYAPIDNHFDWGISGGIGFYCRTKNAGVYQFETRFNYSFGTIFASKTTDYFSRSNPMSLSLNMAWLWEFHKRTKKRN